MNPIEQDQIIAQKQFLEQKKQALLDQQEQIKIKYQQLKELSQNNDLNVDQVQLLKEQLTRLSDLYTQNKQTLQELEGEKETNQDPKKKKKISFKKLLIVVSVAMSVLLGALTLALTYLSQNAIKPSVIKDLSTNIFLLKTFSRAFFVILVIIGIVIILTNVIKIIKNKKNKDKKNIGNLLAIVLGFLMILASTIILLIVNNVAKNAQKLQDFNLNRLVLAHIDIKDSQIILGQDPKFQPIAPTNISFEVNNIAFEKQIRPQLGEILDISLDCGNGQTLAISGTFFESKCFYPKKGNYLIKLKIKHDLNNQTEIVDVLATELNIQSEIRLSTPDGSLHFGENEIIAGPNPISISMDASDVFKDFKLEQYKIMRDTDSDGNYENSSLTKYSYLYTEAGVHYIAVKFPDLHEYDYSFPLRIEQTDKPVAKIKYTEINGREYDISLEFLDEGIFVSEYIFNIFDSNNKKLESINSKIPNVNYKFPSNGVYSVDVNFITTDNKENKVKGPVLDIGGSKYRIYYDLFIKTPTKPDFKKIEPSDVIFVEELPTILKIDIVNIIPSLPNLKKEVLVNGENIISTDEVFQTAIDSNKDYEIKIIVSNTKTSEKSEKIFTVSVKKKNVVGKLLVSPDTVGVSPFTVQFDASATEISDPDDKIVYFSWDFGDGQTKENLSQSIISHVYEYDYTNENGTFKPTVSVTTKKGHKISFGDVTILLTKPVNTLDIIIDSHPTQIARVGDKVDMSLNFTGLPDRVVWDFGNGSTYECKARECTTISQIYEQAGSYVIKVSLQYEDRPSIESSVVIKVQ